jgi:hypothetical protein
MQDQGEKKVLDASCAMMRVTMLWKPLNCNPSECWKEVSSVDSSMLTIGSETNQSPKRKRRQRDT